MTTLALKICKTSHRSAPFLSKSISTMYVLWQVSKKPEIAVTLFRRFDLEHRRYRENAPFQQIYAKYRRLYNAQFSLSGKLLPLAWEWSKTCFYWY